MHNLARAPLMNTFNFSAMSIKLLPLIPVLAIFSAFVSADDDVNLDDISMYIVSERVRDAKTIFLPAREAITDYTINSNDVTQLEVDAIKAENEVLKLKLQNLSAKNDGARPSKIDSERLSERHEHHAEISETRSENREKQKEVREKIHNKIREQTTEVSPASLTD
jgi:hypothetical protein